MDGWFEIAKAILPGVEAWPLFAQALVSVLFLFLGAISSVGIPGLVIYLLYRMIRFRGISEIAGVVGFMLLTVVGWSLWVLLPWLINPDGGALLQASKLVQSMGLFFAVFLLFSLLGKDELDELGQWPESGTSSAGKVFETALMLLPIGIPLWLQIMRLRRDRVRKALYQKMIRTLSSDC